MVVIVMVVVLVMVVALVMVVVLVVAVIRVVVLVASKQSFLTDMTRVSQRPTSSKSCWWHW